MGTILGLLIALIALAIYIWRPHILFIFWMVTIPLLCPLLCLLGGIYDADGTNDFLYRISGFFAYAFILIILFRYGKNKQKILRAKKLLSSLAILCAFFLFHNIITFFSLQSIYINIKGAVYILLPMFVMMIDERTRPKRIQLYYVALFILVVETIFVFLNYSGVRTYAGWYQAILEFPEGANLATGTYFGSPRLADSIATLFCFFCVDFFSKRKIPVWQFLLICVMCGVCLLGAGNRMPIAASVIVFCLSVFLYGKQYKALLIAVLLVGYGGLTWLGSYQGGELTDNDGINRVVEGLTSFTQAKKDKDEDHSTVRLSENLIDEYFMRAPVFGNGRASLGENAYPIADSVSDVTDFRADAHLAFMLVEYGIVGLGLYFLLFANVFKYLRRRVPDEGKKVSIIIMVFFTLLAITSGGIWDQNLFPYIYLYFFSMMGINGYPKICQNR